MVKKSTRKETAEYINKMMDEYPNREDFEEETGLKRPGRKIVVTRKSKRYTRKRRP